LDELVRGGSFLLGEEVEERDDQLVVLGLVLLQKL